MSATVPRQDMPPPGGFPTTIQYKRLLPNRGPSGAFIVTALGLMTVYGFYDVKQVNDERRELVREKIWNRVHLVPLLQAEVDRDYIRRMDAYTKREAKAMAHNPDWVANDLKAPVKGIGPEGEYDPEAAEPVYNTKRFVAPSLINLPDGAPQRMAAQWWRGHNVSLRNLPFHERADFTPENPIGLGPKADE